MSAFSGPNVIKDGLILYIDAANPKSYPGSGTTWTDLSSLNNNALYNGSPVIYKSDHGGALETPATQTSRWIRMPETSLQSLPNGTQWTLEWAMTVLSHSGTRYCQSMARSANDNIFIWQINASNMNIWNSTLTSGFNPTFQVGIPLVLTLTRNINSWRIYKNGEFSAQYSYAGDSQTTVTGWVLDQEQDSVLGGFDSTQNTHANWYYNKLYNRILSDSEIQQNFNATRGRYGI